MRYISTSVLDIFKIGPGPSSSHTIGPMKAGNAFIAAAETLDQTLLDKVAGIKVKLYGSLSATGKGHGTDRAITAGLLKMIPDKCDADQVLALLPNDNTAYQVKIGTKEVDFHGRDFSFETDDSNLKFQNTMIIQLLDDQDNELFAKTYYSIGGGFIRCEGEVETEPPMPPHCYANMRQFSYIHRTSKLDPAVIVMDNEKVLTGLSEKEINSRLDAIISAMVQAVDKGLAAEGVLPGKLGLERKAGDLFRRAEKTQNPMDRNLLLLNAFAFAASEENAAGRIVVTAPTSGSSGVFPGLIYYLKNYAGISEEAVRRGLLIAGMLGGIAKDNASISGAEVGCQGEIGVASAMAAGMIAEIYDCQLKVIENSAECALEHHLGMTCDPIGGYVQIPCIERNAVGAVTAYNAFLIASGGNPSKHKLSFDEVVEVMLETGRDMQSSYKETSRGGLAGCSLCC